MKNASISRLEKLLTAGEFVVTAECGPPRGSNRERIIEKGKLLQDVVDALNVTDNQTAIVRMSSIAASTHLLNIGLEPVMQMVTRDRNRIALQSDIMGAYSLGIRNILCLTGDHQSFGSQPDAMNVFDIDSMNLVRTVKEMRETGQDMSGHELDEAPKMFVGAAANPFADPFEYRVIRLAKKIDAGADFIQTQCVYNLERFREWIKLAREEGSHPSRGYAPEIGGYGQLYEQPGGGYGCPGGGYPAHGRRIQKGCGQRGGENLPRNHRRTA